MTQNNMFAFGDNVVSTTHNNQEVTCPCPATKAGYDPDNDDIIHVAKAYDYIVRYVYHGDFAGIIDESTAKKAWNKALEKVANKEYYNGYEQSITQAEDVKETLGWD